MSSDRGPNLRQPGGAGAVGYRNYQFVWTDHCHAIEILTFLAPGFVTRPADLRGGKLPAATRHWLRRYGRRAWVFQVIHPTASQVPVSGRGTMTPGLDCGIDLRLVESHKNSSLNCTPDSI